MSNTWFSNTCHELLGIVKQLKPHIFRANWHRNLFKNIRKDIPAGQVIQQFDFAMNFRNLHQDEIESAYWEGTQTLIHGVLNYFTCPVQDCSNVVTLILAQISDDLHNDSFFACAGHDASFRYLAETGVAMNTIIQFCNNCGVQYKSRHPFAELACSPLNIIRVYFGEIHRKSHADGFFG